MSKNDVVIGYKAFNADWTCNPTGENPYQYALGETFTMEEQPIVGKQGFHFCHTIADCIKYNGYHEFLHYAQVIALGDIDCKEDFNKDISATNKIEIVRELSKEEILEACNIGKNNDGLYNVGGFNSGNRNTGDFNTGNYNTGSSNLGHCNTGCGNSGNSNTGCNNKGSYNVGNWNEGNSNVGDFNLTNYNLGAFNTDSAIQQKIYLFNKLSNWTLDDWHKSDGVNVLSSMPPKEEDRQDWWDNLPDWNKGMVMDIPNFDCDIFKKVTGISTKRDFGRFMVDKYKSEVE